MLAVRTCIHERKTLKGQRSQVVIQLFEQLPLKASIHTALQTPPLAPEMEWHLNPPSAPHFDGGVGTFYPNAQEDSTPDIAPQKKQTSELFHTILAETEPMLNSRPLTHVSDYPDNEEPLTPYHFYLHRPFAKLPPGVFQDSSYQLTQKSWKGTQTLVNHIWKRLLSEYIPTLHHRSKWNLQLLEMELPSGTCVGASRLHYLWDLAYWASGSCFPWARWTDSSGFC